jgi:signal transduction histidine kinase/ActR/RegA family two-component response regulator
MRVIYSGSIKRLLFRVSVLLFFLFSFIGINGYGQDDIGKETIYQRGKIIIGDDIDFPPYSFLDENNQPTGFNIEIAIAACKAMGLEAEIRLDTWVNTRRALENGELDAIAGMFYSNERNKIYGFSSRHSVGSGDIFTRKGIVVNSIDDLAGKQLLVQKGDIIAEYLAKLNLNIILIEKPSVDEVLRLLETGEYDYAGLPKLSGLYDINQNNYNNIIPQNLQFIPKDYCMVVNKENEDLLYILNAGLYILKTSDEYQAIYDKWLGVYEAKESANFFLKYRWIFYLTVFIFLGLTIIVIILNYLMNQKTRQLKILNQNLTASNNEIKNTNELLAKSQQELQARLEEIEKQGEIIKFKQNFLANMSHEIRTPLTGILGMIDILKQSDLSAEQTEYINILKHSGENLREIINQVLDYSKIEAGKVQLNKKVFAFSDLIVQANSLFHSLAGERLTFDCTCDPKIPAFLIGDKNRLMQIINNLISNSVKFTQKGGIQFKAETINRLNGDSTIHIRISITDSGLGITNEKQKVLFRPFAQIHESDQREFEGTGLGLSICKELAILHGGEIGVESKYGLGSTFWFTFLAEITENTSQLTQSEQPSNGNEVKGLRILLAEDNVVNQKVMSLLLTSFGHKVEIAANGEIALLAYQPDKFDLILMDVQMPVMDGITATKELKNRYPDLPPIVGLSANAFEGDREKYISLGMDEYITKPFKKNDFIDVLGKIFQNPDQ